LKAITQRVSSAKVCINNETYASIKKGILAYVCFEKDDNEAVIDKFINKILNYKFFEEDNSIMSASLKEIEGELMIISQFTLAAITKRGNKPSFHKVLDSERANTLYNLLLKRLSDFSIRYESGIFGADMDVHSINKGPVTFLFDI
tara:strand:- start:279 stop:716 length:438 start_codon:yes stop_codon:yes gene_type:complete